MGDETIAGSRDVFVSYAHADAAWVRTLAENLYRLGLEIAFDEWDIGPGDVLVHKLDQMLLATRDGILVVSPDAMRSAYVQAEYAALLQRAIERGRRLIPVLLRNAELPPLLASRLWIDFRHADGPEYLARVEQLARALKGERPARPSRESELVFPPGTGYTAVGVRELSLSLAPERVALVGDGVEVVGEPPDPAFDFDDLLWRLQRAQAHTGPVREADAASRPGEGLDDVLALCGEALARAFLPNAVNAALTAAVADTGRLNGSLQVALDIATPLADLPWETLRVPLTGPLVLAPGVELFRRIDTGGSAPAVVIPGPLRILVAIGSPEAQNARGELLDMEAELQSILDATEGPRRTGRAFVHILEVGSVRAIHDALVARRYHVLHISCHASPGTLILETADGGQDNVTAERLSREGIPPERGPSVVVLAGCSTARDGAEAGVDATPLPGLARTLVAQGIPSVIAMQAPVRDRYATDLLGLVYETLGVSDEPRPLAAVSQARRRLEQTRRTQSDARPNSAEWSTPTVIAGAAPLRLYDPSVPGEELTEAPAPLFDPGVVVRRIGDLVGRRREQRILLQALRAPNGAGVLIHGIGGVGKSTVAAQTLHRLATDHDRLLVSLTGEADPERVLETIGKRLFSRALERGWNEQHPLRQLAGVVRDARHLWRDRFEYLATLLLTREPMVFLFDNFEDNLRDGRVANEALATCLAGWLRAPGLSRVVITSRYPFELPDDAHRRLTAVHLGPLSWAETRKLFWRLEGVHQLPVADQRRAYEQVGGHPRALEYLDAILRSGTARFADVTTRLSTHLTARGLDAARWCANLAGDVDAALAATVTVAADDVLLDQLLDGMRDQPLVRRLLEAASVYRRPVDDVGVMWMMGTPVEPTPDPARTARLQAAMERLRETRRTNPSATWADVAMAGEREQYQRDYADEHAPPIEPPEGFAAARQQLMALSLLAPVEGAGEVRCVVHRWTAAALAARMRAEEMTSAHRAAAAYWQWRVFSQPQSREQDVLDLLEARFHFEVLNDRTAYFDLTSRVCLQLETWGAWEWEERLLRECLEGGAPTPLAHAQVLGQLGVVAYRHGDYDVALNWYRKALAIMEELGDLSGMSSSYHALGMVAQRRSDYDVALDWYRKSLAIEEQLDNRAGVATSYHQLGRVAQLRGDYDAALDWYRKALEIKEELGDRAGMASSYHQLGNMAYLRGDYDTALDWYRKSLPIVEQLGDRAGMANSYHQLGIVAQHRGDHDAALDWYRKSLAIDEELGNRAGVANSYHQLGRVALLRGNYDTALDWYRKALTILEQLGDRAGMAKSYHQLGIVAQHRGDHNTALDWYRKSLAIDEELGNRAGMATSYHQLGIVAQDCGDHNAALDWYRKALAIDEQLGDRAGMATSYHQLGVLYTEKGDITTAVSLNLRSLVLRVKFESHNSLVDLPWLSRQRHTLGRDAFLGIVVEHVGADTAKYVVEALDKFDRARGESAEA